MSNLTKRQQDQIFSTFYGINRKTFEIESVYLTQGGTLTSWGRDGSLTTLPVSYGRRARDEVVIAFELTEIFETYAELESAENTKLRVAALQQKADAMKALASKE